VFLPMMPEIHISSSQPCPGWVHYSLVKHYFDLKCRLQIHTCWSMRLPYHGQYLHMCPLICQLSFPPKKLRILPMICFVCVPFMLSISCLRSDMLERNLALMFFMSCRTAIISSAIFSKELVIVLTSSFRLDWSTLKASRSWSIAAIFIFKLLSTVIAPGISVCVEGRFDPSPVPYSMLLYSSPCADVFAILVSVIVAGRLPRAMSLYDAFTQGDRFLVLYWSSCVSISVGMQLILNAYKWLVQKAVGVDFATLPTTPMGYAVMYL
jgi:hypothetical protein